MVLPVEANLVPSSTSASFQSLSGDAQLRRRLVRIPTDQRELLDKPESWSAYLRRRPLGFVNVPPDVLSGLIEFHERRVSTANVSHSHCSSEEQVDDDVVGSRHEVHTPQNQGSQHDNEIDEMPGSLMSWSPSPTAHFRAAVDTKKDISPQASPETQRAAAETRDDAPSLPSKVRCHTEPESNYDGSSKTCFISQLPARTPLNPTMDVSNVQGRPAFNDFPSSSLGAEEELEMVAPVAFTAVAPSVGDLATFDPTPPSAQVQVPCTFEPDDVMTESTVGLKGGQVRPRVYKKLNMDFMQVQSRVQTALLTSNTSLGRGGHDSVSMGTDAPKISSNSETTSSVIPSTNRNTSSSAKSPQNLATADLGSRLSIQQTPVTKSTAEESYNQPQHGSPTLPSSPVFRPPSPALGSSPRPRSASRQQAPFIRYSTTYPSYKGSLSDFVFACVIIESHQKRHELMSYQYDDFIRTWSEGYLPYIESVEEDKVPLSAINWYRENDAELVFSASIITARNLDSVFVFYPEETKHARETMGIVQSQEQPPIVFQPDTSASLQRDEPLPMTTDDLHVSQRQTPEGIDHESGTPSDQILQGQSPNSPNVTALRSGVSAAPAVNAHSNQVSPRGVPDAASPIINVHKRPASEDLKQAAAKRASSDFFVGSEAGSVRSDGSGGSRMTIGPSSSARPRFYQGRRSSRKETREQRKLRMSQFKARQRSGTFDPIESSAPVRNAPTSGQR